MIVSDIAGTTRDATDSLVENEFGKFIFIDTAGLRRKSRVYDQIEKYSTSAQGWLWRERRSALL
mgnify:CR=1 FL=1